MASAFAYLVKAYMWLSSSWLGRLFIKYVKNKVSELVAKLIWRVRNREDNKKESKDQVAKLKDPNTTSKEEIDAAIDDALSKL